LGRECLTSYRAVENLAIAYLRGEREAEQFVDAGR